MLPLPPRFLFRLSFPCRFVETMPREDDDEWLGLGEPCRIDNFASMDGRKNFAEVRLGWNLGGLGVWFEVRGKEQGPLGSRDRLRGSDGLTLWLDTRGDRTSHRASRYCHQFHFLPKAGGDDQDEPLVGQSKINRALGDAPIASTDDVPFRVHWIRGGYRMEAFLPASAMNGFDPAEFPTLGFTYAVRDLEHGEQTLGVGAEFPFYEDPSLWAGLELVK
jgi:hypothetical protein